MIPRLRRALFALLSARARGMGIRIDTKPGP